MTGEKQHYLPAAVIGGFGEARSQSPRESIVAVGRRDGGRTRISAARAVAFERNTYRLANPVPGVDPDVVDKTWQLLEPYLPGALHRLAENTQTSVDQEVVLLYVAAWAVRHPEVFRVIANEQQEAAGLPALQGDLLQIARLQAMENTISEISGWRWHVFLCPDDGPGVGEGAALDPERQGLLLSKRRQPPRQRSAGSFESACRGVRVRWLPTWVSGKTDSDWVRESMD